MRIGTNRAKFTVRVIENKTKKSKSFVVDNGFTLKELANKIKTKLMDD